MSLQIGAPCVVRARLELSVPTLKEMYLHTEQFLHRVYSINSPSKEKGNTATSHFRARVMWSDPPSFMPASHFSRQTLSDTYLICYISTTRGIRLILQWKKESLWANLHHEGPFLCTSSQQ